LRFKKGGKGHQKRINCSNIIKKAKYFLKHEV
jgi:hypothetical protein